MADRVVFDCNVYLQALISSTGPAAQCLEAALNGEVVLFYSLEVLTEVRNVGLRPHLTQKFGLTEERIDTFVLIARRAGTLVTSVPQVFEYPRDPKDAHYVDLAIATNARLIVSRDKDLLALNDPTVPECNVLREMSPDLEILTPTELLARLASND